MSYADIIKKKQKEWKCEKPLVNSVLEVEGKKIPFSSPLFNWVTYGGIPRNKFSEIYGDFGSGKSTTVLDLCNNALKIFRKEYDDKIAALQQELADGDKSAEDTIEELQEIGPKKVVYIDVEHAFDITWGKKLGIHFDGDDADIDVIQPPNVVAEDLLQFVREIIETGEIGLIALDSTAALIPRSMLGKEIGERTVAALAGVLATFYPIVTPLLTMYECTFICVNQIRDNLANPYEVNTPGGKSPKFYSFFRAHMRKGKFVDCLGNELPNNTEDPAGCIIEMRVTKQKTAPNDRRKGTYYLMFDSGIRPDYDLAALAISNYNLIRKTGGWYSFVDPNTGAVLETPEGKPIKVNGLGNVYGFFNTHPDYYESLKKYILDDINNTNSAGDDEDVEEAD